MTQDLLFEEVSVRVRSICDGLDYKVRFNRDNLNFYVFARENRDDLIITSTLIELISDINHVNFIAVSLRENCMSALFCVEGLTIK